jgi:hypothetical protein
MDLKAFPLPRFLTRSKRAAALPAERVEGVFMQEGSTYIAPLDTPSALQSQPGEYSNGTVLAETTSVLCRNSAAATSLFIP